MCRAYHFLQMCYNPIKASKVKIDAGFFCTTFVAGGLPSKAIHSFLSIYYFLVCDCCHYFLCRQAACMHAAGRRVVSAILVVSGFPPFIKTRPAFWQHQTLADAMRCAAPRSKLNLESTRLNARPSFFHHDSYTAPFSIVMIY